MSNIVDITAVRLARMAKTLIQQDIKSLTRTTIKEGPCPHCSGAGTLLWRNGRAEPFFHDWRDLHRLEGFKLANCDACGGTGSHYREVICQGEAV